MTNEITQARREEDPDVRRLRLGLDAALTCYQAERFEDAARIFGDVLPRIVTPDLPEAWSLYGHALAHLGRFESAAAALRRALALNPECAADWTALGAVYRSLDRPSAARDALLRATQLQPEDAQVWSNFGVVERALGRSDAAMHCYQRAIATDPSFASAWRNLGNVHRDAGRWADAVNCYERLIELRDVAADWTDLGAAYVHLRRDDEALVAFDKALKIDPDHVDATYNLAVYYILHSEPDKTRATYRRLLELSVASAREFVEFAASAGRRSPEYVEQLLTA